MVRGLKKLFCVLILLISINICYADTITDLTTGMELYKNGNYDGCITKLNSVVKDDPTSVVGYYYLALSYSKLNKKDLAIANYNKVINLGSDKTLSNLSKQAKNILQPVKIETEPVAEQQDNEDDYNPILDDCATVQSQDKRPEKTEKKIVTETVKQPSKTDNPPKFEYNPNREPTNDEIVTAIRILQKAGLLQNGAAAITGQGQNQYNQYNQQQMPQMDSRTQQLNSMLMMMNNGNNNGMMNNMNMMPYMQNNGKVDPQLMQMMLMQQMMPNFSGGNNQ